MHVLRKHRCIPRHRSEVRVWPLLSARYDIGKDVAVTLTQRSPGANATNRVQTGTIAGVTAYAIWGVFPLYFSRLKRISAFELAGWRIVLTCLAVWVLLAVQRDVGWFGDIVRDRRRLGLVTLAGMLVTANWLIYVWAASHGHVVDAAIGYFINPLLSVALGVAVLREQLRVRQRAALALGALAVVVLTFAYGRIPWVALSLAFSFGLYGFCKKQAGLDGIRSLAGETLMMIPLGIGLLTFFAFRGGLDIVRVPQVTTVLAVLVGVVTAIPLVLFGVAAARIPLASLGLLQYLTPVMQLLCGVVVLGEHVTPARWVGIGLVCGALAILAADLGITNRVLRREESLP
jgi:chloramphenicol-sensitive protein RarD